MSVTTRVTLARAASLKFFLAQTRGNRAIQLSTNMVHKVHPRGPPSSSIFHFFRITWVCIKVSSKASPRLGPLGKFAIITERKASRLLGFLMVNFKF